MALETIFVASITILIGGAFCFAGHRWFMVLLPIWGFITGFSTGAYGVSNVYGESLLSLAVIIVAGVILGLLFAVIAYLFFPAAIILLGASLGYSAGEIAMISFGFEPGLIPGFIGIIAATVLALFGVRYNLPKYVVIVSTSMLGSIAITIGIVLMAGNISLHGSWQGLTRYLFETSTVLTLLWIALAAVGLIVQFSRAKGYEN